MVQGKTGKGWEKRRKISHVRLSFLFFLFILLNLRFMDSMEWDLNQEG